MRLSMLTPRNNGHMSLPSTYIQVFCAREIASRDVVRAKISHQSRLLQVGPYSSQGPEQDLSCL